MHTWLWQSVLHLSKRIELWLPAQFLMGRWGELAVTSVALTALFLALIRFTAPCARVRRVRKGMAADLLALLLYRGSLRAILACEWRMVISNLKLVGLLVPALLVSSFVGLVMYGPLDCRYGLAPLAVEEEFVVRAEMTGPGADLMTQEIRPRTHLLSVVARVRVPARRTVWTRCQASAPGLAWLETAGQPPARFSVNVDRPDLPVHRLQSVGGVWLSVPYERRREWGVFGHWGAALLAMSLIWVVPLARLVRLRI